MPFKRILALLLTLVISLCLCSCAGKEPEQVTPQGDDEYFTSGDSSSGQFQDLLSFTATDLSGGTFSEADFANYDVTVINIWATFCGPCRNEMPELARFKDSLPSNVNFITICCDAEQDNLDLVTEILDDAGFSGTTLIAGSGDISTLIGKVMYIPTTILVDKEGRNVGESFVGAPPETFDYYTQAVNGALADVGAEPLD